MATNNNAKSPRNIGPINFDSKDEIAIEIPNEAEQSTDIIVMRAVSPGFLIYKSSWKVTGNVSRYVAFGDDVQKVLEGAVSSKVRGDLDGRTFQYDGAQKIILFRKSNILTYIASVKSVNDKEWEFVARASSLEELADIAGNLLEAMINEEESIELEEKVAPVQSAQEFDVFSYLERQYVFKLRADSIVHRHRAERLAEKLKKFQKLYKENIK